MYEGFSLSQASVYERTVPSYEYLQLGQLTFGSTTYSKAQLMAADPRGIGVNPTLVNYYKHPVTSGPGRRWRIGSGSMARNTPAFSTAAAARFSTSYCDGKKHHRL